ncbi:MAG: RNase adapter RapZ [Erysipelotrichaceae bacterium]|nr:RNase adapter RapZ [Erysipelotrichaceae bacterium]MBQ1379912.1 RNase adapter RapZ [Erysipelotrichaceae bacterium]MBQ1625204.1 RNase adapter RapZ [Erysipelotrichaceae bacterium]MBQ1691931.1 RNase adapter RapZ [Erysipelotrichaceae bacterium]MBQ1775909.1 RNase adapter RapZ [Erysipelotrichaceae bacterium]
MKRLVLISGISGAGKSTASNMLEDMGFTCIDQYPAELLPDLLELIKTDESFRYDKVALTIVISDLERFYNLLSNSEYKPDLILLDANKDIIINRYKFTRRVHPLVLSNTASTLDEAFEIEKSILKKFKKDAIVIDTTTLSTKNLKAILDKRLNFDDFENLAITFESFGFKNGVPDDADMVLDVRVLDNPFYVAELKDLTGNDAPVRDFVLNSKLTKRYLKKTVDLLDLMFKSYDNEEKRHLTICVGCTGGQHRSVTIANYLYEHYKEKYLCYIAHREQEK